MTYAPIQPVAAVLDDEHLPEPVRPFAQAWRDLDDAETNAEAAHAEARNAIPEAKAADRRAAAEAVEQGKPVPSPANQREVQAIATEQALSDRLDRIRRDKMKVGAALIDAMATHREELLTIAKQRVSAAADAFEKAVTKAQADVDKAAGALAAASESLGLLDEIDRPERDRNELGAPARHLTRPDYTQSLRDLEELRADLAAMTERTDRLAVRTTDGQVLIVPVARALQMIRELGAVRVPSDQVPATARMVGLPEPMTTLTW